jgi:hypothetical protein
VNRNQIMQAIRQPTSAAIAGLVFAAILGWVLIILHDVRPDGIPDFQSWATDSARREQVNLALNLIPFAGIAFLWFIAVIRTQLGAREDRFFETVFLGSGLLFIASLFVAAAALRAPLMLDAAGIEVTPGVLEFALAFGTSMLGQFGARMASVFIASAATAGLRSGALPRWLAIIGWITSIVMLVIPPLPNVVQFAFPAWVAAISLLILLRRQRPQPAASPA